MKMINSFLNILRKISSFVAVVALVITFALVFFVPADLTDCWNLSKRTIICWRQMAV